VSRPARDCEGGVGRSEQGHHEGHGFSCAITQGCRPSTTACRQEAPKRTTTSAADRIEHHLLYHQHSRYPGTAQARDQAHRD
jgi:hypothetical protein